MKTIIIFLLVYNSIYSQNPSYTINCTEDCMNKKFPFEFCRVVNGKAEWYYKCSFNPNNEPGLVNYKPSVPICYTKSNPTFVSVIVLSNNQGFNYTIWQNDKIGSNIDAAITEWQNSCLDNDPNTTFSYTNNLNNCCIKFLWSNRNGDDARVHDVNTGKYYLASTIQHTKSETDCLGIDCDNKTCIIFNQLSSWTGNGPDGVSVNFFFNYQDVPEEVQWNHSFYDFQSVVLQELGHWFMLPDKYKILDADNCDTYNSNIYNDVMSPSLDAYTKKRILNEDQKCYFRKLYCCSQTVDIYELDEYYKKDFDFKAFPNPSNNFDLNLNVNDILIEKQLVVTIYDLNGKEMIKKPLEVNFKNLNINISNLNSGIYIITVRNGILSSSKKLVIIK